MKYAATVCLFGLFGCGGGDGGSPDAPPRPDADERDAMPAAFCATMSDPGCGYTPEPLAAGEIALADQRALAERFNPAIVHSGPAIWPVSFDFLLANGGPLLRAEHDGRVAFSYRVDEATTTVVPGQPTDLRTFDMSALPVTAPSTRGYVYFLDFTGTNTGPGFADETWKAAWTAIQGDDPATAPFPPHQYAHLFWLSKADHLLAIQYFLYYPYDKFTNNHEGDWEHVNVVVRWFDGVEPVLEGAHFSIHGHQIGRVASDLYRTGDHVVAFAGGNGCLNFGDSCWCGDTSGATVPYPGRYDISAYWEDIAGDVDHPARAIAADEFTIELLPRVDELDFAARPDLSWYAIPFIAGEPTTEGNHPATISTNNHRSPVGPGAEHGEWEVGIVDYFFEIDQSGKLPFAPPASWTLTHEPPESAFAPLPISDNCTPL
jgi:hypothetical protein